MKNFYLGLMATLLLFFTGCASLDFGSDGLTNSVAQGEDFTNPLKSSKYYLTSLFGPRLDPITVVASNHNGIDMACPTGTPVYATMSGVVDVAGWHRQYGNYVIIKHEGDYKSLYAHMSKLLTSKGTKVAQGDKIGLVGSTGYSTGAHLHFTVYKNNNLVDPLTLALKNEGVDMMIFPSRKVAQLYFIQKTNYSIKKYPVTSFDLDLYYILKDKKVEKEPTINYVVTFAPDVKDYEPLSLAIECGEEKLELKNTSVLYKEEKKETNKQGEEQTIMTVSFTSAMTMKNMTHLLTADDKEKIFVVVKYGDNKEVKLVSKDFTKKVMDARKLISDPSTK